MEQVENLLSFWSENIFGVRALARAHQYDILSTCKKQNPTFDVFMEGRSLRAPQIFLSFKNIIKNLCAIFSFVNTSRIDNFSLIWILVKIKKY